MNDIVKNILHSSNTKMLQLLRYGVVVGIAAPIDLGGYIILSSVFHLNYVLAATISFTISLYVNYLISINWVFTAKTGRKKYLDLTIYAIIGVVGLALTDLIIFILTDFVSLNYIISKLIAFICVFFWSFGSRRYLFRPKLAEEEAAY